MTDIFDDENFRAKVLQHPGLCVVDFWASWCGPCRLMLPILDRLSEQYDGKVKIGKLNVDDNPEFSVEYGVTSLPTIIFFKNGKVVERFVGAMPQSFLEKKIEQNL
ncbi:MAG: thioredoxin [Phycisphaerales bacterium]|nr:thioredoxin [Phycisphaerales bacterium]